mmetsp:Transcript_1249/g.3749  ORF Transcript_1249/g.3749 Transcript_1249/m.3749 type:complete len:360 (+) Transcript_1249:158-1237(+)
MATPVRVALLSATAAALIVPPPSRARGAAPLRAVAKEDVVSCLRREYRSFFAPLEAEYYAPEVTFDDPLSSLSGLKAYRNNVDMLAGRTPLGGFLFSDAAIALHDVEPRGEGLRTRWTLRVSFSALPWKPVARFTGVSDYALDGEGRIAGQTDYWDSIDLKGGDYERSAKGDAVSDFVGQLFGASPTSDGELPFELLRRAEGYVVRRYPEVSVAEVQYDVRPEGYDVLGSYAGGFNEAKEKLAPFLPSIITVPRSGGGAKKMSWPIRMDAEPLPASNVVTSRRAQELTVACLTFPQAATEDAVRYYAGELEQKLAADNLQPAPGHEQNWVVAQYDAIFSVGDRRNEIWIPLAAGHPWDK